MPPIHLANKLHLAITPLRYALIAISVYLVLPLRAVERQPIVIDLTKPAINRSDLSSAPGFHGGAPAYALPITISIKSVKRAGETGIFTVELLVSNTGSDQFALPISQDSVGALRAGNKQRKTFLFKLQSTSLKTRQSVTQTMISTSGSISVPDSLLPLPAGESALVILRTDLGFLDQWKNQGTTEVELRAICSDWKLGDAGFYIDSASHEVKSADSVKLPL